MISKTLGILLGVVVAEIGSGSLCIQGGWIIDTPTKTLDDYQIVSRDWLLEEYPTVKLLRDQAGVGKTGPAIMAAWFKLMETPLVGDGSDPPTLSVLVTCPAYLIDMWEGAIHDFCPDARVERADGVGQEARQRAFESDADFVLTSYNNWGQTDKVLLEEHPTNPKKNKYDKKYRYPILVDQPWTAYIFDEGHRLRGRNSSWTRHVFKTRLAKCPNLSTPIWLLTGTPMVRDGGDFWTYFHLYDKKTYSSYWKFVNQRCVVTTNPWTTIVGNIREEKLDSFRQELAQFSMGRTVKDVPQLQNLEFEEHEYWVRLPTSVVKMITKAKKSYVLEHPDLASPEFLKGSGALYVAQRQIATVPPTQQNPKIDWLRDFLADKAGKVLVYLWYKDSVHAVADALGRQAVSITGDISQGRRNSLIEQWKDPNGPQTLIATIPALSTGVTLTEAKDVVFLEHSELPGDIEQCIGRACRRGQDQLVQVHHVRARQSIDMAIAATLEGRFQGIKEATAAWIKDEI